MDWTSFWNSVGGFFAPILGDLVTIIIYVVVAFALRWVLHLAIDRVVKQIVSGAKKKQNVEDTQSLLVSPIAAVRLVQRTRTLGTVLSNIVNVILLVVTIFLIINTLNDQILGSLAILTAAIGAGLGFGAQNIVKDVLNGLFMVVEDQVGVGDVVDLGPATGVVESVGIRITQVRDVNGTLWFVRNGEILRVGNMSQGWARVIIDLAVPYDSDVDEVQDAISRIALEMASSSKWRSRILERPEVWGLESISAEALVIRLVVKTRTSAKDDVSRELRLRLKRGLDQLGIQLPSLNTVVLSGFDNAGSVMGAKPPRTRPIPVADEPAPTPKKARGGTRGAKSSANPAARSKASSPSAKADASSAKASSAQASDSSTAPARTPLKDARSITTIKDGSASASRPASPGDSMSPHTGATPPPSSSSASPTPRTPKASDE